ncbi:hypothetical protein [Rodentibacter caecimuris]|uniref:hypothetical protein n=1 Tax=Rodentibacter caecimuris TaxID=1796644 RepID=UPI00117AD2BC
MFKRKEAEIYAKSASYLVELLAKSNTLLVYFFVTEKLHYVKDINSKHNIGTFFRSTTIFD